MKIAVVDADAGMDREQDRQELTLDPENWEQFRALAHRMVDDMIEQTRSLREEPAWQPPPAAVKRGILDEALPEEPQTPEQAYEDFLELVQPYTNGNRHPRAWGWVRGTGTPLAAMAEMLAASINPHLGGGWQAPAFVEERCLQWLAQLMGMPETTTGVLASGGTMANLLGLAVARHAKAGYDVRVEGMSGQAALVVYCSSETHMWVRKSMELLGMGTNNLRVIQAGPDFRMDLAGLRSQIHQDRGQGLRPIAVVATAGTVNTGAIDDLPSLAALCREEALWFHVDAAFGALLKLSPRYAPLVKGVEMADSLAFDLHKWMYLPFEIGCVLVADGEEHRATFASTASYLEAGERGILAGGLPFSDRGIELTRGFKALKLWLSLKAHGVSTFRALIEQNMEQAMYLERRVLAEPELELLTPRTMNIVCLRYRGEGAQDEAVLNECNRELLLRLQELGEFVLSGTTLEGRYALRVANTNHRSRTRDFEDLVQAVLRLGRELSAAMGR